jgi:hypothetical protein
MARTSAAHLAPQLLQLVVTTPDAPGAELHVDGEAIEPELGGRVALAPGHHRLEATAAGRVPDARDVTGAAGESRDVTLRLAVPAPTPTSPSSPSRVESPPASSASRTLALVVGGVGVAGVAAGSVLGVVALSKKSTLQRESTDPSVGAARFASDLDGARSVATASTVLFIVGGAALATGVTLWLTAPSPGGAPPVALGVRAQVAGGVEELSLAGAF